MKWKWVNSALNILLIIIVLGYIANYFYRLPKFNEGEKVKDFQAELLNGNTFHLSDLKGNYVLLDFWGSWCGPCRKENPELVSLHKQLQPVTIENAGGFDIVSVAIETRKENWINAITKDGLDWTYHIGQFDRFDSPIAKLYGVREIPTKYLINPEGMIIMVNPSIEEVQSYILEREEH